MNMISTKSEIGKKDIIVLGFESDFLKCLSSPGDFNGQKYQITANGNSVAVYNHLLGLLQDQKKLPFTIICNLNFLKKDNYFLLNNITKHPQLRLIPFILFANRREEIDRIDLLKRGADDCFLEPVTWGKLKKRIEFLHHFKEDMIGYQAAPEQSGAKIPLGKRVFDILFASVLILLISPVLLAIALLIKLSSKGPVIYRSKRVGTNYEVFDFLKFRSMCLDADEKLKEFTHLNTYAEGGQKAGFIKLKNDPRITPIGKFIRKTSLDELPQLFNVLRGEMSIVGNRPLPLYEAEQMTKDEWAGRFLAPAGITGLWQVSEKGKDNLSVEERVGLDIEYALNYSFSLDFKILSRTLPAMIQKEA